MGNKLPSVTPPIDYFMHDLTGYALQEILCSGRFLQTVKCLSDEGAVLVKIYIKRPPYTDLREQIEMMKEIKANFDLMKNKNVVPFQKFFETDKAGFIIRQYLHCSLPERIGTRPFLSHIEKLWISYQLLNSLKQSSFYGIYHGDIKSENVLVTSWNWVYLSDFSFYKPDFIAEDDPSEFSFFFDTSGKRTCYLAPERFYAGKSKPTEEYDKHAFDVFSAGCVIAELFLDGVPIFDLSQLLSYRKKEYDPTPVIKRIKDNNIQELIIHMIQREPENRKSAEGYLKMFIGKTFPCYFKFIHTYIAKLMGLDIEQRVRCIQQDLKVMIDYFKDPESFPNDFFQSLPSNRSSQKSADPEDRMIVVDEQPNPEAKELSEFATSLPSDPEQLLKSTQIFIRQFDKVSNSQAPSNPPNLKKSNSSISTPPLTSTVKVDHLDKIMPSSTLQDSTGVPVKEIPTDYCEALVLILPLLYTGLNALETIQGKLITLDLLLDFAKHVDDESRLQKIVPVIVGTFLNDNVALVRATAITNLTKILEMVKQFPPSESNIFPDYLMHALAPFCNDTEELVRQAFAANLALLAETAARFLENAFYQIFKQTELRSSEDAAPRQGNYDKELSSLQDMFYNIVKEMFTKDTSSVVKRTLLADITRFCLFFGKPKTNEYLLPLIITFLNDRDRQLRSAFFHNIVGMSAFVGMTSLESFIYPIILQALTDEEEFVIDKAINSLACLCELGLFRKYILLDIAQKLAPLLFHPNIWIRYGVISAEAAIAKQLQSNPANVFCFLMPILKPYLFADIVEVTETSLLQCLKPPVSRVAFDAAISIASNCLQEQADYALESSIKEPPVLQTPQEQFLNKVKTSNIPEEEKAKIEYMAAYITTAARTSRPKVVFPEQQYVSLVNEVVLASQALPVHTITTSPEVTIGLSERNITDYKGEVKTSVSMSNLATGPTSPRAIASSSSFELKQAGSFREKDEFVDLIYMKKSMDNTTVVPLDGSTLKNWRPKGLLVANLHEHAAAVNQIQTSCDNQFFATCSDDGSVKIWDCQRLLKNVTNRSRLTYATQGGKITAITMCENSHSIASGSSNGSIHVFRVEYGESKKDTTGPTKKDITRYTGTQQIYTVDNTEGAIVNLDHFNADNFTQSVVVYATTKGKIHAYDLRSKKEIWTLCNPSNAGLIHSFIIDPSRNWLIVGTARGLQTKVDPTHLLQGFYTCWDVRFELPVKTWRQPDNTAIYSLRYLSGTKDGGALIAASTGMNSVYVWDVESSMCRHFFRVISEDGIPQSLSHASPPPPAPPALKPIALDTKPHQDFGAIDAKAMAKLNISDLTPEQNVIRALYTSPDASYIITGGADRKIRYWDIFNPAGSYVISGIERNKPKPKYISHIEEGASIIEELPPAYFNSPYYAMHANDAFVQVPSAPAPTSTYVNSNSSIIENRFKAAHPSVNHMDSLLDIKALELPQPMLISSSRSGDIKVWK